MADVELTEETTSEELKSFVDTIAAERAGEEAEKAPEKEPKSDAQITAEHADNKTPEKKPAAPKAVETAKAPKGKGEDSAKAEPDDRPWLDDDLKAEISAYGISEDALADFTSREEVERAMRFFDETAQIRGREAMAEGDKSKAATRDDKGRFVKSETEKKEPEKAPVTGGYEPQLDKSIYDDEIVNEFTRMRDHYESRLEALTERLETLGERFAEADAKAEEQQFDNLIDSLGHADLFGKTNHENEKQLERRKDLHVAVKAQMLGLQQLGRPTEMSESLINRVARMVFAEELGKKDIKSRTNRISRQSNGRMGGGATRPTDAPESTRDWADRAYRELANA